MQILIESKDLLAAPADVQTWVQSHLFESNQSTDEKPKPTKKKSTKGSKSKAAKPTLDQLKDAAMKFYEAKGEEALAAILEEFGIGRIPDCPEDKIADLLAKVAIDA